MQIFVWALMIVLIAIVLLTVRDAVRSRRRSFDPSGRRRPGPSGGPAGDREPRRPLVPAGSAAATRPIPEYENRIGEAVATVVRDRLAEGKGRSRPSRPSRPERRKGFIGTRSERA